MADMNDVGVIPPDAFAARSAQAVCSTQLASMLATLFASHDCFKDELPAATAATAHAYERGGHDRDRNHDRSHGGHDRPRHNHHSHSHHRGGSHNHRSAPPQQARPLRAPMTHVEKLLREVTALLNKINNSNASTIEVKLLRLVEPPNANLITRAVLQKAVVNGTYMKFLVALLKRLASKYDIQQELDSFHTSYPVQLAEGLTTAAALDYADYDGFCAFTKLKAQLVARQQLLLALVAADLAPPASEDDAMPNLVAQLVAFANAGNNHMIGVVLTLLDAACKVNAAKVRVIADTLHPVYHDIKGRVGKKNEFQLEGILHTMSASANVRVRVCA